MVIFANNHEAKSVFYFRCLLLCMFFIYALPISLFLRYRIRKINILSSRSTTHFTLTTYSGQKKNHSPLYIQYSTIVGTIKYVTEYKRTRRRVYYRVVIVHECPCFFIIISFAAGSNRVRTDVRRLQGLPLLR